jgi:hypothetical protein
MSELDKLKFVGREEYLTQIISLVKKSDPCHAILVEGYGGIGKTWLLQELKSRLCLDEDEIRISEIIDCDAPILNDAEDLCTQIAKQLSEVTYREWLPQLRKLRENENRLGQTAYKEERRRIEKFLIDEINQVSRQQRLVFLIDTVEKVGQADVRKEFWEYISKLCHQLDNVVLILAGRPSIARHIFEQSLFKEGEFSCFELREFTCDEMHKYIDRKEEQLHFTLGKDLTEKIISLSSGRPIMIEFGVEYAYREVIPDWLQSSEDIESTKKRLQKTHGEEFFEAAMVQHIMQLRTPIDRLTLILSRIYPLDVFAVGALLEISEEDAKELFDHAQSYFFIKSVMSGSQISLHDIVRDLVNKYVWTEIDPDIEWRKQDSCFAAKYFEVKDRELRQQKKDLQSQLISSSQVELIDINSRIEEVRQIRESITKQWLQNALYADPIVGFDTWYKVANKTRSLSKKFSFVNQLFSIVKQYEKDVNPDQQFKLIIFEAKIAYALKNKFGVEQEVEKLEEMLLSNQYSDSHDEADLCNVLGMLNAKLHLYDKALIYQKQCLSTVQDRNPSFIPHVANQVGYLYRQINDYNEAERYYKQGWNAAMQVEVPSRGLTQVMASIQNNLGFLYGIQKNYLQSDKCFKTAIDMWSMLIIDREIAGAEIASAIILRNRGKYKQAKELLERALTRCTNEVNDHQILCRAYLHLGWNQWFNAEIIDDFVWDTNQVRWDTNLLSQARSYLEESLKLAEKYGIEEELPAIQHQTASVCWHLANQTDDPLLLDKAIEMNNQSYQISLDYKNIRYAIDSLVGKAEFDYATGNYKNISNYINELYERFQSYEDGYSLYFGRIIRIEGDAAFQEENYDIAFEKYAQGISKISKHGGSGPYSIQRELNMLQQKIKRLPVVFAKVCINKLNDQWKNNIDLQEWCDQQTVLTRVRATQQSSSHD